MKKRFTAALASIGSANSSLPLQFTLNLDVKNPGAQAAAVSALQYIWELHASVADSAAGQVSTKKLKIEYAKNNI